MQLTKSISKTALICRYAICLALMVVCAQILVPLPFTAVPVTLAFFMVFVIGGVMGPFHGGLCMLIYVIMGMIGLPVFAGFNSFSALIGPTGGYIIGYVPMAALVGLFNRKFSNGGLQIIGMMLGACAAYLLGALWYAFIAKVSFVSAVMLTIVPFIAADAFKMILAYLVIRRVNKIL